MLVEWLTVPCPRGSAGELPKAWWLGAYLVVPKPWLALEARREPRISSRLSLIKSLGLRRAFDS